MLPTRTAASTLGNLMFKNISFPYFSMIRYDETSINGNICVLLSSCEERDSSCSSCHTAPVPCSHEMGPTSTGSNVDDQMSKLIINDNQR